MIQKQDQDHKSIQKIKLLSKLLQLDQLPQPKAEAFKKTVGD